MVGRQGEREGIAYFMEPKGFRNTFQNHLCITLVCSNAGKSSRQEQSNLVSNLEAGWVIKACAPEASV